MIPPDVGPVCIVQKSPRQPCNWCCENISTLTENPSWQKVWSARLVDINLPKQSVDQTGPDQTKVGSSTCGSFRRCSDDFGGWTLFEANTSDNSFAFVVAFIIQTSEPRNGGMPLVELVLCRSSRFGRHQRFEVRGNILICCRTRLWYV